MDSAAFFPARMASMAQPGPVTTSPPAKIPFEDVAPVWGSTRTVPSSFNSSPFRAWGSVRWPMAAMSVSAETWNEAIRNLLIMIAPSAPHMAEELWTGSGYDYSIHNQSWPKWDRELAADEEVTLVVQINGKVRDKLTVPVSITEEDAKKLAYSEERIKAYVDGKTVLKTIYVPGKLLNIVVKP